MKVRFAVSPGTRRFEADGILRFAEASERLGFDTIWLSDVPLSPIGDPLLTLAAAAARTSRLKLGANVVPLGRNPMLLARDLAQLDQLSDGRLLLTFVPGLDQPGERAALGVGAADRGARLVEIIDLLRRWWAGERVTYQRGELEFREISVEPRPVQEPLEVWMGGTGPRAMERVAASADGWLTAALTPDEAGRGRATILAHAERMGREIDVEHFGISVPYARAEIPAAAAAALRARRPDGSLDDIIPIGADALTALVKRHLDNGLSKFVLRPVDPTEPEADLAWLADVVLPLQT
jgi:probable F420-dependent oxidoreductase